jgi:beta-aspartyl-peptidase (threonine type)
MPERLVLLASANGLVGMPEGREILRAGGSALDAVQRVVEIVEDNPDDHTVGYGGYPNLLGVVELDASIMDGRDRRAGAVAGLVGFRHPVAAARRVLEDLPHVLLVGEGAAMFAAEAGLERRDMLTDPAAATWQRGLQRYGEGPPPPPYAEKVSALVLDPEHVTGTVNVIARDSRGDLASAASTSGWAWKYPGRAGDTGMIGAGNYCDGRYGAATCTGWGELAIRGGIARATVDAIRNGRSVDEAANEVLGDLPDAGMGTSETPLHLLTMDRHGVAGAFSTTASSKFAYWDDDLDEPDVRPRTAVAVDAEGARG